MYALQLFDYLGTIAFAYSGAHVALRKNLNLMGAFIVAMLTASAGGAISQVLLGVSPTVLHDLTAFYLVTLTLVAAIALDSFGVTSFERSRGFVIADTVGLVSFAMTGAHLAMSAELSFFGVVVIAFLSAVGGGIVRDVIVNDVPTVLHTDLYGPVAALCGALVFAAHEFAEGEHNARYMAIFLFAMTLRLVAHRWGWRIPTHPRIRKRHRPAPGGD